MSQMMTKSLALAALLALGACSSGVKLDDASKSGANQGGAQTDPRAVAPVVAADDNASEIGRAHV